VASLVKASGQPPFLWPGRAGANPRASGSNGGLKAAETAFLTHPAWLPSQPQLPLEDCVSGTPLLSGHAAFLSYVVFGFALWKRFLFPHVISELNARGRKPRVFGDVGRDIFVASQRHLLLTWVHAPQPQASLRGLEPWVMTMGQC
jgi:hypothetical protein